MTDERAEALHRATAVVALAVGGTAAASPRALLRVYGIDPRELTGAGAFGWRLFGVRTAVIGAAALKGNTAARDAVLPVQLADQLVFAHAYRTGSVPKATAAAAMLTSGAIIALGLAARGRG